MPTLFVIQGNDQGSRVEFNADAIGIGRDSSNLLRLHDTEVSRNHARLERQDDHFLLVDLESSNGTYVNGKSVRRQKLQPGDRIQIGQTVLLYSAPVRAGRSDLVGQIDVIAQSQPGESSKIVTSISHSEGTRFLTRPEEAGGPWLARGLANLQMLYGTVVAVRRTLDLDQLLERILEMIFEWVEADRGCILIRNPETEQFEPKAVHRRKGASREPKISISRTIFEYTVKHGDGVLTSDARRDERFSPGQSIVQQGIREAICVPMQGRHDMVGIIYIDTSTPPEQVLLERRHASKFNEDHLKLLIAVGHLAALAVEETRYYQAMVQAERLAAIGQTIATLSHHIKNILQGVRGGSYLIDMGLNEHDEPVVRRGWGIVEKNQKKIYNLVMDMLTFSTEREPTMQEADLNHVVAEVAELMQSRAEELGVRLTLKCDAEMPRLTFDAEGIHRAVLNVVTNALDAVEGRENGLVEIETAHDAAANVARVTISDNGVGIPPDQVAQIFNLFTSNKGARGTGLGLAVSRKIMNEHGGTIRVQSTPEQGSRFVLELPAQAPNGQTQA